MLERAARAACIASGEVPDMGTWDSINDCKGPLVWEMFLPQVRAVLMAVREPDESVKKKLAFNDYTTFSYGGDKNSFDYLSEDNVAEFSRDLIDAILEGK